MKARAAFVVALLLIPAATIAARGAQPSAEEQRALRTRIERTFDVVPLSDGIALRPKSRIRDVRLIEIAEGGIAVNGTPVTGRELRERIGNEADDVIRLSYLDNAGRRALFAPDERAERPEGTADEEAPRAEAPQAEAPHGEAPPSPAAERRRRARGDRVRILGSVAVERDEHISGNAVAVLGSARVDGEVEEQVVAVLGSVDLGPQAIVHGDVVAVGGRVRRAPGAQIRGGITEVGVGGGRSSRVDIGASPWLNDWAPWGLAGFGQLPRLMFSMFHLLLLVLLSSIAFLVARSTVESAAQRVSDEPLKTTLVGIVAQILLPAVMFLSAIVLAISIIGIPLLLLLPFAVLFLLLMAVAGFAGAACAAGQWARRRFGLNMEPGFLEVSIGVVVVLLPLLLGRLIGLAGWTLGPFAFLLVATGLCLEYLVWTAGFGAVLTNAFGRWQARRAARSAAVAPPPATA